MGGLSIGVFWGSLVSAAGLAALSLSSPLPPRVSDVALEVEAVVDGAVVEGVAPEEIVPAEEVTPAEEVVPEEVAPEPVTPEPAAEEASSPATEIPLPSGTEFNRPPPEPQAALPAPDAAPTATAPQAPAQSGDVTAPTFDTATAALPNVSAQAPAPIAALADDAGAPASPGAAPAPAIANSPAALAQPDASDTPQVRTSLLPQVTQTPEATDTDPAPVPLQTPVFPTIGGATNPVTQTPSLPSDVATGGAIEAPTPAPVEDVAALTTPEVPATSSLPQVSAEPEIVEAEAVEGDGGALPAIQAFSVPFDASEQRPLMAVILIDEPDSRIELSTLTRFSFPVAFAVDPLHPDASERAAAYRDAGFEVVILASMIPEGATAADLEVALSAAVATLPEAVAVIDTPEGRIQGDRPILDAMVAALSDTGHGLLAFPRGLNAAEQSASRAGVPGATLFRLLDDEGQRATVITRFLARAAFTASQEGTVIVAGHTRPDTVTALFSWALGGRSEAVAVAPLSATLLRASEP